jgi:CHAT domain-containing protein
LKTINRLSKQRVVVFTTLCLFILYLLIAQDKSKSIDINLGLINKEKAFIKSLDSLRKISNGFLKKNKWDSIYEYQKKYYFLGNKYKKYDSVILVIKFYSEKIPESEFFFKANSEYILAYVEHQIGNIYHADKISQTIIRKSPFHKDTILVLQSYILSGIIKIKSRDYKGAIKDLLNAITMANLKNDTSRLSRSYENLGIAYLWSGDYNKSRNALIKSIELDDDPSGAIELEISRSYLFEGSYDKAIKEGNVALRKSIESENLETQYYCLTNIANIYAKKNNPTLAINYYYKALKLRDNIQDKREIVKTLLPLAQVKLKLNKADEALAHIDEAIKIIGYDRKVVSGKTLPSEMYLIELFAEKANCYLSKNGIKADAALLESAQVNFEKSIEVLTDMRQYHDNPGTIEEISKGAKDIFEKSITTALAQYALSKDKRHLDRAFINAQKYGAFNLRKNISERKALDLAVTDATVKNRFLKAKVDFLNEEYKLNAAFSEEGFNAYNNAKNSFLHLRDSLEKSNKRFGKLSQKINYVSIKEVQSKLQDGEVFVQYFTGSALITVFNIYKNDIVCNTIDNDQSFKDHLQQYLTLLGDTAPAGKAVMRDSLDRIFQSSAYFLYQSLVQKSIENRPISKMIVVPDGALFRIPFESFITKSTTSLSDASSYLLSKCTIDYLYYPAQFLKDDVKAYKDYFVGFGLEYDKYTLESMKDIKQDTSLLWIKDKFRSESLSHLYFADDEVAEVAKHFSGKTYLNDNATKSNLMQTIHKAGILHISAHSCVDFAAPEHSAIILSKNMTETDNLIKYDDIAEQDLNSQMVILSSCSSSSGKISEAEGVSSLSKAFFEAGSQSVVGSYWSVPDEVSKLFMEMFYKKLSEGKAKDVALREVKLEFISSNSLVNPYYQRPKFWAAWSLYGDVQPLKVSDHRWWWAFMALATLCLGFWYAKGRSKGLNA